MSLVIRPARAEDFRALLSEPLPFRVKAMAAEKDGEVIGLGGISYLPKGEIGAFFIGNGIEKYPVTLHKAALKFLREAGEGFDRIVSLADPRIARADKWHERLGFKPAFRGRHKVFVWTP